MYLGVQIETAEGFEKGLKEAKILDINSIQLFARNPKSFWAAPLDEKRINIFKKLTKKFDIFYKIIHCPYLVNLASPDRKIYELSIKGLASDLKRAAQLGADFVVVHPGRRKTLGPKEAIKKIYQAVNSAFSQTKNKIPLLLETTAGVGSEIGSSFYELAQIISGIEDKNRIGICLDTCHSFSAGFDFSISSGIEETLKEIDKKIRLRRLKVIHLNDSQFEKDSHKDRHEDIGRGKIGLAGFGYLINHPKLADLIFILETPKKSLKDDIRNLKTIRNLIK